MIKFSAIKIWSKILSELKNIPCLALFTAETICIIQVLKKLLIFFLFLYNIKQVLCIILNYLTLLQWK